MTELTVAKLLDIVSRAHSVIVESDGADEHAELIGELSALSTLARHAIDTSHMGCAADVVILEAGDSL